MCSAVRVAILRPCGYVQRASQLFSATYTTQTSVYGISLSPGVVCFNTYVCCTLFTFVNEKVLLIQSALFTRTLFTLHLVLSKSTACAVRLKELIGHRIRTVDGSVPLRPSVSLIAMLVLV